MLGNISINNNLIAGQIQLYNSQHHYCSLGISLSDALSGTPVANASGTTLTVVGNRLLNTYNGILVNGFFNRPANVGANYVSLAEDPFLGSSSQEQFGVRMTNNGGNSIYDNNITGYTDADMDERIKGIITSANAGMNVRCNFTGNVGHGFEFQGTQTGTKWWDNTMDDCFRGYVLNFNGIIGNQFGTASNPAMDNYWQGNTWSSATPHIYTINSIAANSKIHVRTNPSAGYFPTYHGSAGGFGYTSAPPGTATIIQVTGGPFRLCATLPHAPVCPTCKQADVLLMENIVLDTIVPVVNVNETKFISKLQVYRALNSDPTLMNNSNILQNFYSANNLTNKGKLNMTEDNIAAGNIISAQNMLASVNPSSLVEQNHKNMLNAAIHLRTNVFSIADSLTLIALANGCPFTDGIGVYQARALYNEINNSAVLFYDNCPDASAQRSRISTGENIESMQEGSYMVYPNPAKEIVYVSYSKKEAVTIPVKIYDLSGKLFTSIDLIFNNGIGAFNVELENGIYFVKIGDNETQSISKLIIQK